MDKDKESLIFLLRLIISIGIHYCWFQLYLYTNSWEHSLEYDVWYKIGDYYWRAWWTLPLTAIMFNVINILVCKKLQLKIKLLAIIYWIISIIMSLVLLSPWIVFIMYP